MLLEMMMKEGTVTVLREEAVTDLLTQIMIVIDPQVHIVEIGVAQTTAMDRIQMPDLKKEIILMIKLKVLKRKDTAAAPHHLGKGHALEKKQKV